MAPYAPPPPMPLFDSRRPVDSFSGLARGHLASRRRKTHQRASLVKGRVLACSQLSRRFADCFRLLCGSRGAGGEDAYLVQVHDNPA